MNRYARHFDELRRELNVDVIRVVDAEYPDDPWGYAIHHPHDPKRRAVILSHTPNGRATYIVALHELGHCARGNGWSADLEMDREVAAWGWALARAKFVDPSWAATYALKALHDSFSRPGVIDTDAYRNARRWLHRVAVR